MIVFYCRICGTLISSPENQFLCECDHCGSLVTVPLISDESRKILYNEASQLLFAGQFAKALTIFEQIVAMGENDSDCYWSIVMCRYGIQYLYDKSNRKYCLTVNRFLLSSVTADADYQRTLQYSDPQRKKLYIATAKEIDRILQAASSVTVYDIILQTRDKNNIADEIYISLSDSGYRVYYESQECPNVPEAYRMVALASAQMMLIIGCSSLDFSNATSKSMWQRFVRRHDDGERKQISVISTSLLQEIIPVELRHFPCQDKDKTGYLQDLIHGVDVFFGRRKVRQSSAYARALLEDVFDALNKGQWKAADELCEKILHIEPQNAFAYIGKLMVDAQVFRREQLGDINVSIEENENYIMALRFADAATAAELKGYSKAIADNFDDTALEQAELFFKEKCNFEVYRGILAELQEADKNSEAKIDPVKFVSTIPLLLADRDIENIIHGIIEFVNDKVSNEKKCEAAKKRYSDSINELGQLKQEISLVYERIDARETRIYKKRKLRKVLIIAGATAGVLLLVFLVLLFARLINYNTAVSVYEKGEWETAYERFESLKDFKDANVMRLKSGAALCEEYVAKGDPYSWLSIGRKIYEYNGMHTAMREYLERWCFGKIAAGEEHYIAIYGNDTRMGGNNRSAQLRSDLFLPGEIETIASGSFHVVGLKKDGTVIAVGENHDGQCDVSDWTNIIAIDACGAQTIGLCQDGTVRITGAYTDGDCSVESWTDIVAVAAGGSHFLGLKSDGTVLQTVSKKVTYVTIEETWTDIVSISANYDGAYGVKRDGTCISTTSRYDLSGWRYIIKISAGSDHLLGLKSDGSVVGIGDPMSYKGVEKWEYMVEIAAGNGCSFGNQLSDASGLRLLGVSEYANGNGKYGECTKLSRK